MPVIVQPRVAIVHGLDDWSVGYEAAQVGQYRKALFAVTCDHDPTRCHDGGRVAQNFMFIGDHLRKAGPVIVLAGHGGWWAASRR